MRIGIIAEGPADVALVKHVLKKLTGIDTEEILSIRPCEMMDETDKAELRFSNWELVMQSCEDEELIEGFFELIDGEALLVVHIDTAERGEAHYGVTDPQRTGHPDWKEYSRSLRDNVRTKLLTLIPERFRKRVAYAIAIEETDAWLIPLFAGSAHSDSASHINAKETLRDLVSKLKKKNKYIHTNHNNLNYSKLGNELAKKLTIAREGNESLNLFCAEVEEII